MNQGKPQWQQTAGVTNNSFGGDIYATLVAIYSTHDYCAADNARLVYDALDALDREQKIRQTRKTIGILEISSAEIAAAVDRNELRVAGQLAAITVTMVARTDNVELAAHVNKGLGEFGDALTPASISRSVVDRFQSFLAEARVILEKDHARTLRDAIAAGRSPDVAKERETSPALPKEEEKPAEEKLGLPITE